MVIAAIIFGAGVVMVLDAVIRAPIGYQDENGFHLGAQGPERQTADCQARPN